MFLRQQTHRPWAPSSPLDCTSTYTRTSPPKTHCRTTCAQAGRLLARAENPRQNAEATVKSDEDCDCTGGLPRTPWLKAQLYAFSFSALSYSVRLTHL